VRENQWERSRIEPL